MAQVARNNVATNIMDAGTFRTSRAPVRVEPRPRLRSNRRCGGLSEMYRGEIRRSGAALAFLISGAYSCRTFGGSTDVHVRRQIRSRIGIGGALSGRANGICPSRPCDILDPKLARRLRWQSGRRPELEHLRPLSEL